MSNSPLVSVCMITYNHEKYISEAIEGVLIQEVDFELELVIADDCSSDLTGDIVRTYFKNHSKGSWIKYFRHSENKGMMSNFVWAIKQCKGKYIALCEGDDYWIKTDKLQIQVDFLRQNPQYSLVSHYSKKVSFNAEGFQTFGKLDRDNYQLTDPDYHFLPIPTASMVFRNLIQFPDWIYMVYGGDRALVFLASHLGKIKILDFYGAVYRVHQNGMEQQFKKDKFSLPLRNLQELPIYYNIAQPHFRRYIARKLAWNNFYLSLQNIRIFRIDRSVQHFGKSVYWRIRAY